MEAAKREANMSLTKFSYALDELEKTLRPVLSAVDTLRSSGNEDELDAMSRARLHISLCYTVNSLFCMYLRAQGVDPATHPVSEEIARVQDAFMRMRKVEAGLSADHQPKPDRDRRRHIVNAKKSAAKLGSLVFPEEVELLKALRGRKRKRDDNEEDATDSEKETAGKRDSEDSDGEDTSERNGHVSKVNAGTETDDSGNTEAETPKMAVARGEEYSDEIQRATKPSRTSNERSSMKKDPKEKKEKKHRKEKKAKRGRDKKDKSMKTTTKEVKGKEEEHREEDNSVRKERKGKKLKKEKESVSGEEYRERKRRKREEKKRRASAA